MIDGVRHAAMAAGLTTGRRFNAGMRDLHRATGEPDGVFCYTFFKGRRQALLPDLLISDHPPTYCQSVR